VLGLAAMLAPAFAQAHPHIWIQQHVRVFAKDGKYTHVEIEGGSIHSERDRDPFD